MGSFGDVSSILQIRARIESAIAFIPADDRDRWLRMGMAVKSELGDPGFDIWDVWSQRSASYKSSDAKSVWRSIKEDGGVTIASLYREARDNGWLDEGQPCEPDLEEIAWRRQEADQRMVREDAEIAQERRRAAERASMLWSAGVKVEPDHPYLVRKQVSPVLSLREIQATDASRILGYAPSSSGQQLTGRVLLAPVKVGDKLSTIEMIDGDGRKSALAGRGSKTGGYWAPEHLPPDDGHGSTLLIGEGVATVLSAYEASRHPAIAALCDANVPKVAAAIRERYPAAAIVILADLVKETGTPNAHAIEAARAVDGKLAVPDFGSERPAGAKDFNDMARLCGKASVEHAIAGAFAPTRTDFEPGKEISVPSTDCWPEPQPLTVRLESEPYPIDAVPETIRAAVEEVAAFVKAPIALVASSALAALSLAAQAHVDVKRADKLQGPVSLFLLTIADSGERKSTCDGFFTAAIREYEKNQAVEMKPAIELHEAEMSAWTAERQGLLAAIKDAGKNGKPTEPLKSNLAALQLRKPKPPRVPRLILGDETPENLSFRLATEWPSAGVVTSEAGVVLGAHGMAADSAMRNMALLNILWDGGQHSVGRRTSESFTVKGARLTVALQIQELTLRSFVARTGDLARGIGWFARCLLAWPQSTQGSRPFTEAPPHWPHLAAFNRRIHAILEKPAPIGSDGALSPTLMTLEPDAKASWVAFHDAIEAELASGGDLYDVRDVASKTADNAVRLAALLHVLEHGIGGAVGVGAFKGASRIAAWHLNESRRFFGELALPAELADATRLDRWLIDHCRRNRVTIVGKNYVRQYGPLRDATRLSAAIRELVSLDRLRVESDGKRSKIKVNPALIEVPV